MKPLILSTHAEKSATMYFLPRSFALLFTVFMTARATWAQWEATDVTSTATDLITDVAAHQGRLFSFASTPGLMVSSDNGNTWTPVNQNGFTTNPISVRITHLVSAGTSLYAVTFNAIYSSSMVYVSTDDGANFVPDTAGIPKSFTGNNECINIDRLYYNNGHLVADVANLGNWHKPVSGSTWTRNDHAETQWGELFAFHEARYYTHADYRTWYSDDNGLSWNLCGDSGLPTWFTASILEADPLTGRLYTAGKDIVSSTYSFLISDNQGDTWVALDFAPYLANNWLGLPQTIQTLFVYGSYVEIALDNDANN